jgi:hypothetical protein
LIAPRSPHDAFSTLPAVQLKVLHVIGKKAPFALLVAAVLTVVIILLQSHHNPAPAVAPAEQSVVQAETTKPVKLHRNGDGKSSSAVGSPGLEMNFSPFEELAPETNYVTVAEQERMKRMADNLLKPQLVLEPAAADRVRAGWLARFGAEPDPLLRQEIVTEMVQLDDPQTIKAMTELLSAEKDSSVRQQLILILGYMRATVPELSKVSPVMMTDFQQTNDLEERRRILEVMSNLPANESVKFMQAAFTAADASAEDRFNAAEGLFKLSPRVAVDPELIRQVTERLKQDARSATADEERLMAAQALAAPGQDNKAFLGELLATETNPKVQQFLQLATQQYPTH